MQPAYGAILGQLASKPPIGAPPAAMGVNAGQPPAMPNQPPPPTGTGAIPLGDPGSTPKGAADDAILTLRTLQGHFPSLAPQIGQWIDTVKAAAKPPAPPTTGGGAPSSPPGADAGVPAGGSGPAMPPTPGLP